MKKEYGQYFTKGNCFELKPFKDWFLEKHTNETILEPFVGGGDIIKHMEEIKNDLKWEKYDLFPLDEDTKENNSILNPLDGYDFVITNPPYLYKTVATKMGVSKDNFLKFDNLYKAALFQYLQRTKYLAFIIPASFINSLFDDDVFNKRLTKVINLNDKKYFDDTEIPTCLVLFDKLETNNFEIWNQNELVGIFEKKIRDRLEDFEYSFNKKMFKNNYVVKLVDSSVNDIWIEHLEDSKFVDKEWKVSDRNIVLFSSKKYFNIEEINKKIDKIRIKKEDVLWTPFMGLKKDGYFRRRLSFKDFLILLEE